MNTLYDSPQLDSILGALANQKRRTIIHALALHPSTTSTLGRLSQLSLPAMHKHLNILESANLIIRKKSGRTNFIALNPETLSLAQLWIDQYKTGWSSPESSLTNYIARMQE